MSQTHDTPLSASKSMPITLAITRAFANGPVAAIAAFGIGLESIFAWQSTGHALWSGGWASVQAVIFMLWFWLTVSWVAQALATVAQGVSASPSSWKRRTLQVSLLIGLVLGAVTYVISWGIFLQTSRFASWEAVRFTLANLSMLGDYIKAADRLQFLWLGLIVSVLFAGIPYLARQLRRARTVTTTNSHLRWRGGIWLGLLMLLSLVSSQVASDPSLSRRITKNDQFRNCLNPLLTLTCSSLDAWQQEPILACLDTDQLIPLVDSQRTSQTSKKPKQRSVILVAIESLRSDVIHQTHQGQEITPNINRLAGQGLQLTRAYAQSTHSDYADVCLASSLYPLRTRHHHYYRSEDPWPKTLLYDFLKPHGYDTAIISSQNEAWGGMDQFLQSPGLDWFYHPQNSSAPTIVSNRDPGLLRELQAGTLVAGKFPDRHTTDVALQWIKERDRPFFLAMNFQSSHFPYLLPNDCPQHFQPCHLDEDIKFSSYPEEKVPQVKNAYYNALAEADRQIGRLVEQLEELGILEDVILVVTGENGEAFRENGEIGHACNPVEPAIHIAAVIHSPAVIQPEIDDYPFEHVDLAPTLCGLLGVEASPNFQGIDVLAANRPPAEQRLTFAHVLSPIARADAVTLAGRWKYVVTNEKPQGALLDIQSDPTESRDLSTAMPELATQLRAKLNEWRQRQLAYYHFPQYYGKYNPPSPPRWPATQVNTALVER